MTRIFMAALMAFAAPAAAYAGQSARLTAFGLPTPLGRSSSAQNLPPIALAQMPALPAVAALPRSPLPGAASPAALVSAPPPLPDLSRMDDASAKDAVGAVFDGPAKNQGPAPDPAPGVEGSNPVSPAAPSLRPTAGEESAAASPKPAISRRRSATAWIETRKGGVTLSLSAAVYLSGWAVQAATGGHFAGEALRRMGEAALIGGMCDYIAIKMIFERRWYLPNSGVLPRNREKLIASIAQAVETQWLTPESIHQRLKELQPAEHLGRFLETASLERTVGLPTLLGLSENLARYVDTPAFRRFIEDSIRANAPASVRLASSLGLVDYREVSAGISARLRQDLAGLPSNPARMRAVEEGIHAFGASLREPGSAPHEAAERLMAVLADQALAAGRGEIGRMVQENLGKLSDEEIRLQIEGSTRTHLDWIRVNGGIFGALFGAAFGLINFAIAHAASVIAALR